jgi:hypothetical protein
MMQLVTFIHINSITYRDSGPQRPLQRQTRWQASGNCCRWCTVKEARKTRQPASSCRDRTGVSVHIGRNKWTRSFEQTNVRHLQDFGSSQRCCWRRKKSECDAEYFRILRRVVMPSPSGTDSLLRLLGLEDEGTAICRNIGKYPPNDTASHPRRLESFWDCMTLENGTDRLPETSVGTPA